jgi:hypothetical protein
MFARQQRFYSNNPRGSSAVTVLEAAGERELPDANLNESQRRILKDLARSLRPLLTVRELAYLAGAVEVEANLARDTEAGSR